MFETPKQRHFLAIHQNGENMIKVQIKDYLDGNPEQIEQSESLIEVYHSAGVEYYLFSDVETIQAAWINGQYECYISGSLSIVDLKKMIDSIEKG